VGDGKDSDRESGPGPREQDEPIEPEVRSREEVARELGAAATEPDTSETAKEGLDDDGPLRLDKSGALAGRPKLKPVRAHRKKEDAESAAETAGEEPPAGMAAGDEAAGEGASVEDAPIEDGSGKDALVREAVAAGPRKASLPPRIGTVRPEGAAAERAEAEAEIEIPAGTFLFGESKKSRENAPFKIDRHPITNADYETFVKATGHRPPLYWAGPGSPEPLLEHPVVGVDYYDALAYARWRGKDLPYEDEWERAARGTDGRIYPWGNDQEYSGANTARVGLKMTVPSDLHPENVSPDGCRDMVGNAWELTHSPAPGGGVVVRGGSWYDFALYAKSHFRFASRPDARNGTIGFRCCRRAEERPDAPREVSAEEAEAEIAARRGPEAPVDKSTWTAERRDLVLDAPRLRTYVAEARAEALLGLAAAKRPTPVLRSVPAPPDPNAERPLPPPVEKSAVLVDPDADKVPVIVTPPGGEAPIDEPPIDEPPIDEPPADGPPADEPPAKAPRPEPVPVLAPNSGEEPAAEATPTPATPGSEPALPRIHIGGGPPVSGGKKAAVAAPGNLAWKKAAEDAVRTEHNRSAASRVVVPRSMPATMWVLLAAGFLLFGGLLVVLVNRDEDPQPGVELPIGPTPAVRSPLADLPDMPSYDAFPWAGDPARIHDAADRAAAAALERDTWVLIFVDLDTPEAASSLLAAHAMHRRLATHDVQVAVVLARPRYETESGALPDEERLAEMVKADGGGSLMDGIHILLEPADGSGRGLLRLRCMSIDAPVAAALLRDGLLETRSTPPEGGFSEASLVGIASRALELVRGR